MSLLQQLLAWLGYTKMPYVNEKQSMTLTVAFFDENGSPVIPSAVTYRIDDLGSQTSIVALTSLTPALSIPVNVTSNQNRILNQTDPIEQRTMTFEYDYGGSKHGTGEYRYEVRNLYGVS